MTMIYILRSDFFESYGARGAFLEHDINHRPVNPGTYSDQLSFAGFSRFLQKLDTVVWKDTLKIE